MRIRISRVDPATIRLRVDRQPHPPVDVQLESRSMLLHDLAHYAVEGEQHTDDGFWGLLAAGHSLSDLRSPAALSPEVWERLMAIERVVARLQADFRQGRPTGDGAWRRLRAVHGAWSKVKQGETLQLAWPASAPHVVADTV